MRMKSKILKIAVCALLGVSLPVNAATLHEDDDVRLDLDINYTVRLLLEEGRDVGSRSAYDLAHEDLDVGVGVSQELGEYLGLDLTGFGYLNTDWVDTDWVEDDRVEGGNYEAYVGLDIGHAVIYAGSLYWGSSLFAVQSPYNLDLDYDVNLAGRRRRIPRGLGAYEFERRYEGNTALFADGGDQSLRVDIPTDYVTAVISTDFENEVLDLFLHTRTDAFEFIPADLDGIELGLLYQYIKPVHINMDDDDLDFDVGEDTIGKSEYMQTYGVRVAYALPEIPQVGAVKLAADYSINDVKRDLIERLADLADDETTEGRFDLTEVNRGQSVNLALIAPLAMIDDTIVGVGWGYTDAKDDDIDSFSRWYVNATHHFTNNVSAFAEIGGDDEGDNDIIDGDTGYLLGMNVNF